MGSVLDRTIDLVERHGLDSMHNILQLHTRVGYSAINSMSSVLVDGISVNPHATMSLLGTLSGTINLLDASGMGSIVQGTAAMSRWYAERGNFNGVVLEYDRGSRTWDIFRDAAAPPPPPSAAAAANNAPPIISAAAAAAAADQVMLISDSEADEEDEEMVPEPTVVTAAPLQQGIPPAVTMPVRVHVPVPQPVPSAAATTGAPSDPRRRVVTTSSAATNPLPGGWVCVFDISNKTPRDVCQHNRLLLLRCTVFGAEL